MHLINEQEQLRSGLLSKDYVLLRAGPNKKLQMQDWSSKPIYAKAIKAHLITPPCPKTKISDFQQICDSE